MIQPTAPAATPAPANLIRPDELAAPTVAKSAKTRDFSAVLALESEAPVTAGTQLQGADPISENLPGRVGKAAASGKNLPPSLPPSLPDDLAAGSPGNPAIVDSATEPDSAPTEPEVRGPIATPAALPLSMPALLPPSQQANEETPAPVPQGPPAPRNGPGALPAAGLANALQHLVEHRDPANPGMAPEVVAARLAGQNPAHPAVVGEDPQPRRPLHATARTEEIRIDLAKVPSAPLHSDLRRLGEVAPALSSSGDLAPPGSLVQPGPAMGQPVPAPVQPLAATMRPHEFAALVDRLSAAREALNPQSVAITVAHHDFGPVRLRFRSEDSSLSVAISSADPAFARAAAASPLPVLPTGASDQSGLAQQRNDNAQSQTAGSHGSGGSGQPRGGSPERNDEHARPRHSAPDRGQSGTNDGRRGIFA